MADPIILNIEVQSPVNLELTSTTPVETVVQLENPIELQAVQSGIGLGPPGLSAYQIWLDEGNTGTEQDFLDSLKGEPGTGTDADSLVGIVFGGLFQP